MDHIHIHPDPHCKSILHTLLLAVRRPLLALVVFYCSLALPLAAQKEVLHGTWEGVDADELGKITTRLTFEPDGRLEVDLEIDYTAEDFTEDFTIGEEESIPLPQAILESEDFAALERVLSVESGSGHGTYQVRGDSLLVNLDEFGFVVDGESLAATEFWVPLFRFLFRLLFATFAVAFEEDLSDEELAERLATVYEDMASDPEFQALVDELLAEFEESPLPFALTGTYAIEGDTLFITSTTADEEGEETIETLEFHRIAPATAVAPTTWGSLKSGI